MNQKEKDILKANPVLAKPDFAEQLRQWAKKEAQKEVEQNNESSSTAIKGKNTSSP